MFKFDKIEEICNWLNNLANKLPEKFANASKNLISKLCSYSKSFMEGFTVLDYPLYWGIACVTSVFVWGIEAYVAYLIVDSFSLGLGFSAGLFVLSLISFSTMIPSTSVFLGPYQVAYLMALGIFGIEKSTALAVSTVHQGILIIILTILGGYYLLKFNISMKDINKNAQ